MARERQLALPIVMPERVQRSRAAGWRMPEGCVYVGRPTKWGNPHRAMTKISRVNGKPVEASFVSPVYARQVAIAMYERDLIAGRLAVSVEDVRRELRGRSLACWCPLDHACHADVLLRIAAGAT